MNMIVYRDKTDNTIKSVQPLPEVPADIDAKLEAYNVNEKHVFNAALMEVADDGLEAFLWNDRKGRIESFKEELRELCCAVSRLSSDLPYIDKRVEEWDKEDLNG